MKYVLTENSEVEVKIGDTIPYKQNVETPIGKMPVTIGITVTQTNVQKLLDAKIIKKASEISIAALKKRVAAKLDLDISTTDYILSTMFSNGASGPALQLLLKAASDILSPGMRTVKSLPKVYSISLVDGRIHEINTTDIRTYEHFAYFISKSQAKQVRAELKEVFDIMYGE